MYCMPTKRSTETDSAKLLFRRSMLGHSDMSGDKDRIDWYSFCVRHDARERISDFPEIFVTSKFSLGTDDGRDGIARRFVFGLRFFCDLSFFGFVFDLKKTQVTVIAAKPAERPTTRPRL
jgi:hypothetical protein